jgi:two-component system OmpR family response regulator
MRVLIVDDEAPLRRMVRLALDSEHTVDEVDTAEAALRQLAGHGPYDVILLDQKLPAASGLEVLPELKRLAPDATVVMLTAHASLDLATAALAAGARHFLAKPMTPELLRGAVAAARPRHERVSQSPVHVQGENAVTLNGFVIEDGQRTRVKPDGASEHVFTVRHALEGWVEEVAVTLEPGAFRGSGRPGVPTGSRLARLVARRALAEHIWREGLLPEERRLAIDAVAREDVEAALEEEKRG